METVWKYPFCSSVVSDSRNRWRLGTSPSVDARVSEPLQSVGGSKTEFLPSDCVCKACYQSVEKLLKVKSGPSSILNTLNASIQALSLTQTISSTQSGQRGKRANIPTHHQSVQRCIPVAGTPSEWLLQCCCLYSPSAFTAPLNEHTLANPYFRVHTANISLRH